MGLAPFDHDVVSSAVTNGILDTEEVVAKVFDVNLLAGNNWSRNANVQNVISYNRGGRKIISCGLIIIAGKND